MSIIRNPTVGLENEHRFSFRRNIWNVGRFFKIQEFLIHVPILVFTMHKKRLSIFALRNIKYEMTILCYLMGEFEHLMKIKGYMLYCHLPQFIEMLHMGMYKLIN